MKKLTYIFIFCLLLLSLNVTYVEKIASYYVIARDYISNSIRVSFVSLEDYSSKTIWGIRVPFCSFDNLIVDHSNQEKPHTSLISTPKLHTDEVGIHYPWKCFSGPLSPITKDYFRCKGSLLNPPIPIFQDGKIINNIFDCGGTDSHSLPLRHDKEFIYPILLELLNTLQSTLRKSVIITSGHRCPVHNRYVDSSIKNSFSKHTIGAEVSFYIQGIERQPQLVISCIEEFYKTDPRYGSDRNNYFPFVRYEKETDVVTKPWMNKEIFVKFYYSQEGRNGDNRHPFPYFSIQVRFDRERQLKVTVSPQDSEKYLHY